MTQKLQRVFLLALLSHVLAFSSMFVIASSPFDGGAISIASFFPTALLLALVAYVQARKSELGPGMGTLGLYVIILVAGLGSLLLMESNQRSMVTVLFLLFSVLLIRRMYNMIEDMSYIRRALYEQFHVDMRLLVLLAIPATFWPVSQDWQYMVLPFLFGFILVRMMALSTASRITKQVDDAPQTTTTWAEKWQGKMPILIVVAATLGGWMLSVMGVPVRSLLVAVLTPINMVLGWVLKLLVESGFFTFLGDVLRGMQQFFAKIYGWILCSLFGICEPGPIEVFEQPPLGEGGETSDLLPAIIATVILAYVLYRMFRNRKMGRLQMVDGVVEKREFILDENIGNKKRVRHTGLLGNRTRMRKVYRKFLLTMKKQGYVRTEGETALEYIQKIATTRPEMQDSMQELTDYYMQERYGGKTVDDKLSRSEQLSQEINKKK